MRNFAKLLVLPVFAALAACGGRSDDTKLDDALSKDLALASQVQPYQPQQFVSPTEMGYGMQPGYYGQPQQYPVAQRPVYQSQPVYSAPAPVRRTSTASRSSGTTRRAEPIRNTKRDAIIGGVAGAAIGVATSRDKVKGGIIGAATGAVLGGIIGHTVDVKQP
ncbi:MAG TPA: YMGG-like glycine zipper-containing protein [Gemmatimonadaceae bacterium]|nr:YMGG-like glycine zipper-containing protein [Gemmatimonadaceae bacterium]